MLIIKFCPERTVGQGQYLVQLDTYVDSDDVRPNYHQEPHNRFAYYCDKSHLKHMYQELKQIFEPQLSSMDLLEQSADFIERQAQNIREYVRNFKEE